jgi:hypothetical protein
MTELVTEARASARVAPGASQISLVDLLDRLLGTGVVLAGDVIISLAGVDLVEVRLNALITSVRTDVDRIALAGEVRGG